jgi:Secretion system C-terminal sorting domain
MTTHLSHFYNRRFSSFFAVLIVFLLFLQHAKTQCTTASNGQWPSGAVPLNTTSAPKILATDCYAGEFSRCSGTISGNDYTVTSSVATDFITITNNAGAVVIAFGTQPLTFTAPNNNNFRVYRHVNSACDEEAIERTITVTCADCPPPVSLTNDICANATNLGSSPITVSGNNTGAVNEGVIDYPICDVSFGGLNDVWYKFTTNATGGDATITFSGSTFDGILSAYSGCSTAQELDCSDVGITSIPEVIDLTSLPANTVYYIRISGFDGEEGTFNLNIAGAALPIELKSFTGTTLKNTNLLKWITASERNVQSHILERSVNGIDQWISVGQKPGNTLSKYDQVYEMEDLAPVAKACYRIRTVDLDGSEKVSHAIVLTRNGDRLGIMAAYPNPATELLQVQFNTVAEETVTIQVTDLTGRIVYQQQTDAQKGYNQFPVALQQLTAGTYTLQISGGQSVAEPVRFVKQ